jgi:hypothetical protein
LSNTKHLDEAPPEAQTIDIPPIFSKNTNPTFFSLPYIPPKIALCLKKWQELNIWGFKHV